MIVISDIYGVLYEDGTFNQVLLNWYQQQKDSGASLYLASNVSAEKAQFFWQQPNWPNIFNDIFASGTVGYAKPSKAFYLHIEEKISLKNPENLLFIDDTLANVEAACHLGWNGYHYTGWEQFKKDFKVE
ncbi:MAG: HAD-IA family hydrolase [Alphaproteobacteria bacterium]|nr:HAD-IA family hydrolase [Alphaproteobacteria bacterium]MDD9920381.1 HAD-IA family hydrolase [Alphaproteobacteria bacterium]